MADDVMDEVETAEVAKPRGGAKLTPEQKQAAGLRREATILRSFGYNDKAAELVAKADALAPVRAAKGSQRVDPLAVLTDEEVGKLMQFFKTTKQGFANIAKYISAKKLSEIAGA